MRRELLPPEVDGDVLRCLADLAEDIRDGLDVGDDVTDMVAQFNESVPVRHEDDDFFAVSSSVDSETFVRCAFAVPPKNLQVSEIELIELIAAMKDPATEESHRAYWVRVIENNVPLQPNVGAVIGKAKTPEEALDSLKSYRSIQLGPGS